VRCSRLGGARDANGWQPEPGPDVAAPPVLAAKARMRRPSDFALASRRGRRSGQGTLVLSLYIDKDASDRLVGVVAGRRVGPAVRRNRVKRRLRQLVRDRLAVLPAGSRAMIRALPGAAEAGYAELAADLDAALRQLGLGRAPA
jgi:ribonuclease P protein component